MRFTMSSFCRMMNRATNPIAIGTAIKLNFDGTTSNNALPTKIIKAIMKIMLFIKIKINLAKLSNNDLFPYSIIAYADSPCLLTGIRQLFYYRLFSWVVLRDVCGVSYGLGKRGCFFTKNAVEAENERENFDY